MRGRDLESIVKKMQGPYIIYMMQGCTRRVWGLKFSADKTNAVFHREENSQRDGTKIIFSRFRESGLMDLHGW